MNRILVVLFDSESKAYEGRRVLKELHEEGSITVYAAAIVSRDPDGQVLVKEIRDEGALPLLASPVIGGLVGLLGGALGAAFGIGLVTIPFGVLSGTTVAGFVSFMLDFVKVGDRKQFATDVGTYLAAGKAALLADVGEERTLTVDIRLEAAGGAVFRQPRNDAEHLLVEQELKTLQNELEALQEEYASTTGADRIRLQTKREALMAQLQAKVKQAEEQLEMERAVKEAKVKLLQEQEATAQGAWKASLKPRRERVEAEYQERRTYLRQAIDRADKVLAR
jgi:uncharacterized membrane protein